MGAAGTSPLDGQTISPAPLSAIWLGYDSLVRYDAAFKPQPMLAESWDLGSDYKSIKFNLRKGVQFHTGREFTSDGRQIQLAARAQAEHRAAVYEHEQLVDVRRNTG